MDRNIYRIHCNVDNGFRHERYEMYVSANSQKEAIDLVKHHWNSQYDTTVEVRSIETMPLECYEILCVKELS